MALKEAANESTVALLGRSTRSTSRCRTTTSARSCPTYAVAAARCWAPGRPASPGPGRSSTPRSQTELSRYPIDLRSVSHGTGSFARRQLRYDYMPADKAKEYAKPGDRPTPPLG